MKLLMIPRKSKKTKSCDSNASRPPFEERKFGSGEDSTRTFYKLADGLDQFFDIVCTSQEDIKHSCV